MNSWDMFGYLAIFGVFCLIVGLLLGAAWVLLHVRISII